jgi:DNA invertase Pin-like site-specific DNA recombinase
VSTNDQDATLQVQAQKAAGCTKVYQDVASGKLGKRPELDKLLKRLQPDDTLAVWKLDRLGRSLQHLVAVINGLRERDIAFKSLTNDIDTTTANGRLVFHIFAAIAEFERELIVERTMAGLAVAHANRHRSGRKPKLSGEQRALARKLHGEGTTVTRIAGMLNVSRPVIYRAIAAVTDPHG